MSLFAVKSVRISDIKPHPNADALEIAMIEGSMWQTVVARDTYQVGDTALYVPVEAVLPEALSDRWGVTKYLSNQRVRAARLRGEMSYGFLAEQNQWPCGEDLTDRYGITKYEPPVSLTSGDMDRELANFPQYTDIENVHNFPNLFSPGETIVATEKRHGTNSRIGFVLDGDGEAVFVCGSRTHRRKLGMNSLYETPLSLPGVNELLSEMGTNTVLFGELFGAKIQGRHFSYGSPQKPLFEAFDLWHDGAYLDNNNFRAICGNFGVVTVPVLYEGPFDIEALRGLTCGSSSTDDCTTREGLVIRPLVERHDPNVGRVVLKFKGDDFLLNKHSN